MADASGGQVHQIGPYKIISKLGAGGMGTVYRATHTLLGRDVALKVLSPNAARDDSAFRRFKNEARANAIPHHENIVLFYEYGEDKGLHYLALELVEGMDLLALMDKKGRFSLPFSVHLIRQVVKALDHAHKHGLVHRDIKPSNLLITKDRVVKLTDMGLARRLDAAETDRVTRDGTTVGTVDYMAPEQAKDSSSADIRSDIYSLGCTWYQMLAGEVPYPVGTALERLYKHAAEPIPSIRRKNDKVTEEAAFIIEKMMEKKPADRFQTPAELLEEIDRLDVNRTPSDSPGRSLQMLSMADSELVPPPKATVASDDQVPSRRSRGPKVNRTVAITLLSLAGVMVVLGSFVVYRYVPKKVAWVNQPVVAVAEPEPVKEEVGEVRTVDLKAIRARAKAGKETEQQEVAAKSAATEKSAKESSSPKTGTTPPPRSPSETWKEEAAPATPAKVSAPSNVATTATSLAGRESVPLTDREKNAVYGPWRQSLASLTRPKQTYRVRRGSDQSAKPPEYAGFRAAWNEAAKETSDGNTTFWVEAATNGPLFGGSLDFFGRPVHLEATDAYLPTVVYEQLKPGPDSWFSFMETGKVEVVNLHFVLFADDIQTESPEFDLFRVVGSDISFRRCTFTVLGTPTQRVNVVRLAAGKPENGKPVAKVLFENCVSRGVTLAPVAVGDSAVDILVENCGFFGGTEPLFRFGAGGGKESRLLRVAHSTLLGGRGMIEVFGSESASAPLSVRSTTSVWATVPGGKNIPMILYKSSGKTTAKSVVDWESIRTVFVDWMTLLATDTPNRPPVADAASLVDWQRTMNTAPPQEYLSRESVDYPKDIAFDPYPTIAAGPWEFLDSKKLSVGYNPKACREIDPAWFERTYGTLPPRTIDWQAPLHSPGLSDKTVTLTLEVGSKQSLTDELARHSTAKKFDVTLTGKGRLLLGPIRLKNQTLILKFPANGEITAVPTEEIAGEVMFGLIGGSLQIENGRFELMTPRSNGARFARLQGGDVRLIGCRVQAPLAPIGETPKPMIRLEAERGETPEKSRRYHFTDTLLAGAGTLVAIEATDAAILAENCVFVSQTDGVRFGPGTSERPPYLAQAELKNCTFSTGGGAIAFTGFPAMLPRIEQPILIHAANCLFTDLLDVRGGRFTRPRTGSVMRIDGDTLASGLPAWQGTNNGFDATLGTLLDSASSSDMEVVASPLGRAFSEWMRAWGIRHESFPLLADEPFTVGTIRSEDPFSVKGLQLAPNSDANVAGSGGTAIGANLGRFDQPASAPTVKRTPRYATSRTTTPMNRNAVQPSGNALSAGPVGRNERVIRPGSGMLATPPVPPGGTPKTRKSAERPREQ